MLKKAPSQQLVLQIMFDSPIIHEKKKDSKGHNGSSNGNGHKITNGSRSAPFGPSNSPWPRQATLNYYY